MHETVARLIAAHGGDPASFRAVPAGAPVLHGTVPGERALALWRALAECHPQTGLWPVVRGDMSLDDVAEELEGQLDAAAVLARVPDGDVRALLESRAEELREALADRVPGLAGERDHERMAALVDASGANAFSDDPAPTGPWPTEPGPAELVLVSTTGMGLHDDGRPLREVLFALVPAAQPHDVPAWLAFGGWNDCPHPEEIVAVLREWSRTFGAVPAAITRDVIECFVPRPPRTEAEAMALAAEQWLFCDDIVSQGTETVRALALELWCSPHWFFWWD